MELIKLLGSVLGGLGLFLLAIGMMTDGLKLAAGSSLRKLLAQWSQSALRGIYSGFIMTAVVQSSSAVTVASLGFVNAGLINMRQALGIIYGANIGTTMTGWLVALIGFKLNIQAFALPLVGIGMLIKLLKQQGKAASFGMALVGFGLFFIGIDILKGAFEASVQAFDISQYTAEGITGIMLFLVIGILMTIATQSSSASIALTITAASSGLVGIYAAGAMVIGANIGTTSTALLASIGATSNAKRVAAAQVVFNVGTGIIALIVLPVLFYLIATLTSWFGVNADPAVSLALFHTVFNVLGVLIIFPYNDRLAQILDGKFRSWEDKESHPRFLDKTVAQTPPLAANALLMELLALAERLKSLYDHATSRATIDKRHFEQDAKVIKLLSAEISKFIVNVESSAMSEDITEEFALMMRIDQYFLTCITGTERLAYQLESRESHLQSEQEEQLSTHFRHTLKFMEQSLTREFATSELYADQMAELQSEHDRLKESLLVEATRGRIAVEKMTEVLDALSENIRLVQHWFKAFVRIQSLEAQHDALPREALSQEA